MQSFTSRKPQMWLPLVVMCAFAVAVGSGCGQAANARTGTVTNGATPVDIGSVRFTPSIEKGNDGPTITVPVKQGQFTTAGAKAGVTPGPNVARVEVVQPGGGEAPSQFFELDIDIPADNQQPLVLDIAKARRAQ